MTRERAIAILERLVILGGSMTSRALQAHPETSGLSVIQYRLWVHVVTSDGIRVCELARRIGALSQTMTRLVQRLEARGLVSTARGEVDRREVIATRRGSLGRHRGAPPGADPRGPRRPLARRRDSRHHRAPRRAVLAGRPLSV